MKSQNQYGINLVGFSVAYSMIFQIIVFSCKKMTLFSKCQYFPRFYKQFILEKRIHKYKRCETLINAPYIMLAKLCKLYREHIKNVRKLFASKWTIFKK